MDSVELTTITYLKELKVPQQYKGYAFIISAVKVLIEKPQLIYALTNGLYPAIAKDHNILPRVVESRIRYALSEVDRDALMAQLKIDKDRMTNSYFLAALTEAVRIQCECLSIPK